MPLLKVLIVDDHAIVRDGLRTILSADPALQVVGEAADGHDACALAQSAQPDIVVMDVSMPTMNGAEATRQVLALSPHSKVVVLSAHDEPPFVHELMNAGATAYVLKRTVVRDLIRAIHIVAAGGVFLDSDLASASRPLASLAPGSLAAELTSRETDVACLIARGHTNAEIAMTLSISGKTVETYRARLMTKLGLKTRAQLVQYAVYRGWLQS